MGLTSFLPRSRLRSIALVDGEPSGPSCEEARAAVMMVDLASFTGVSEQLASEGSLGAEKMSRLLDAFYGEVSDAVFAMGGDVLEFAGDGIVAMWPASDGERAAVESATSCAVTLAERSFGSERLRARLGVSYGELRTYELDSGERWASLFAGEGVSQLTEAAHAGEPGEVVLSPSAWRCMEGAAAGSALASGAYRLERLLGEPAPLVEAPMPRVADGLLMRFLPPLVASMHEDEPLSTAEWSAGFRDLTVVFVNLTELEVDPVDALDTLQAAFAVIERLVRHYDGRTYQFLMDDNGISAVVAFGLPGCSLERRQARALTAALAIQRRLSDASVPSSIGVASGRLFCGVCGSPRRRAYAMVGHAMNVAARLMQYGKGAVLCDAATAAGADEHVMCESLGRVRIKGMREPVEALRPSGMRVERRSFERLLGRDAQRERVLTRLFTMHRGYNPPVVVEGEAGVGKSHLLADIERSAASWNLRILRGGGDAMERSTAFFPWRRVLADLLEGLPEGRLDAAAADPAASIARGLEAAPELRAFVPVLNAILPLGIPENDVTREMEASARADSVSALMVHLLEAAAARERIALVLDDAHWFDSRSLHVMLEMARRAEGVLVVIGTRPSAAPGKHDLGELERVAGLERVVLEPLQRPLARRLVEERLGVDELPDEVEAFIWERAEGHPLHSEELALALIGRGAVEVRGRRCRLARGRHLAAAELPSNLHGAITSRFDQVSAAAQLAIKTAAVIGHSFSLAMLRELFPLAEERVRLPAIVEELCERGILARQRDRGPLGQVGEVLSFRHVIMRDVAYEGLLHVQRRELHQRAAEWLENSHGADRGQVLPLLAHHWEHAGDARRTIDYLEQAGAQALSTFSNREARGFLDRAARVAESQRLLVGDERRARWLEQLGFANLMLTEIDSAGEQFMAALELRRHHVPRTKLQIAARLGWETGRQIVHRLWPDHAPAPERERERHRVEAAAYGWLSEIAYFQNRPLELVHNCLRSLNAAEAAGEAKETAQGYAGTSIVLVLLGMLETSRAYRDRGVRIALESLPPADTALSLQLACVHALSVGDWHVAEDLGRRAVEINLRLGDRFRMQTCQVTSAFAWLFQGEIERADAALEEVLASAGAPQIKLWAYGGLMVARLGDPNSGPPALPFAGELEQLLADHAQTSSSEAILCHGLLALACFRGGGPKGALERADRVLGMLEADLPVTYWLTWGIAAVAEVYLARLSETGPHAELESRARRILGVLRKYALMLPTARPTAAIMRGLYEFQQGRRQRALRSWRDGAAQAAALGMKREERRARELLAQRGGRST